MSTLTEIGIYLSKRPRHYWVLLRRFLQVRKITKDIAIFHINIGASKSVAAIEPQKPAHEDNTNNPAITPGMIAITITDI